VDGSISDHKIFIYVYNAAPMVLIMFNALCFHSGRLIKAAHRHIKQVPDVTMDGAVNGITPLMAVEMTPKTKDRGFNPKRLIEWSSRVAKSAPTYRLAIERLILP
jgi:hypothetical protein